MDRNTLDTSCNHLNLNTDRENHQTSVVEHQKSSTTTKPTSGFVSRSWTAIGEIAGPVLRALGLPLISHAFNSLRHITGRGLHEPIKIAICKDRTVALLRSLIHLIPISVALFEIVLNWNTYYVGVSVYNQATYRLLAKIHEMLIQASLTAVIFSYVRHEITVGHGVPFGTLVSGLHISQFSYLWSMEFWAAIRSVHRPLRKEFVLLGFIVGCILLAMLAGPSSAVLLIPRLNFWPAGATDVWINATLNNLYPTQLDASHVPDDCLFAPEIGLSNACPASEWESIREFFALSSHMLPDEYKKRYGAHTSPTIAWLSGKSSQRQQYMGIDIQDHPRHRVPILSTTQTVAAADALTETSNLWLLGLKNATAAWGHGAPLSDQSDATHTLTGENLQGFSLGVCLSYVIRDGADSRPIAFPHLYLANDLARANANITLKDNSTVPGILHPGISPGDIITEPGSHSHYRLRWVDLPQPSFNGSSIGAVVLLPQAKNLSSNRTWRQDVLLCNLAAGWGTTTLQIHTADSGIDTSVSSKVKVDLTHDESRQSSGHGATTENADALLTWSYPDYPQRPISIRKEWAESLNPIIRGTNRSVFDLMIPESLREKSEERLLFTNTYIKEILVQMISNGLARVGYGSTLQGSPKSKLSPDGRSWIDGNYWLSGKGNVFEVDPVESKDWVKFHVNSRLQGYAYNTQTSPPRLAIAVMIAYCIIALAHVLYSGITGISSTCWDSIAEVTALAMNSKPTKALRNTCAGIRELHIFQLPVRVLAVPDKEGEGEHLELVFGEEETEGDTIKANRKYGTMPSSK